MLFFAPKVGAEYVLTDQHTYSNVQEGETYLVVQDYFWQFEQ